MKPVSQLSLLKETSTILVAHNSDDVFSREEESNKNLVLHHVVRVYEMELSTSHLRNLILETPSASCFVLTLIKKKLTSS